MTIYAILHTLIALTFKAFLKIGNMYYTIYILFSGTVSYATALKLFIAIYLLTFDDKGES
jgi:hypothetical protein